VKILIADDSKTVRSGIGRILQEDLAPAIFGEASSGPEATEMLQADSWDAVVLDISMPGGNGFGFLEWRKAEGVRVPVVMQSTDIGRATVKRCLDLGATAFVAKEKLPDELVPAVIAVTRGEMYLCQAVTAAFGLLQIPRLADGALTSRTRLHKLVARRLGEHADKARSRSKQVLVESYAVLQASCNVLEQISAGRRAGSKTRLQLDRHQPTAG
jgi:two-component system, NarL family, invasion response regulator UvrY